MKIFTLCTTLLFYICLSFANASEIPWKLWKKTSAQSVSYRPAIINDQTDDKLIEIKATATVKSSISGFLFFLQNVDNTQHWLVNASESKIIKQYSATENSFYIKLTKIWPLQARILILNSLYWQNDDLSVEIKLTDAVNVEDYMLLAVSNLKDYLQVKTHSAHWKIMPKQSEEEGSEIAIEYIFIADGRGETPKWLADHLALKSIWKSMRNIRRQLPKEKWQQQTIKGITELSVIPLTKKP
ncbi:hypothetical protein [Colwellia psychrerythraea]|uniref:START domain-containing protein n=1 Tax=Colwellia psychrerythraea (strain 34H / ATCC BAA-681) TaxID=167879 RepID=Q480A8_COLP3|nr:hypothetical protein [Colwellia psychrerythraea]AAZ27070.1 hypothetical protein CPS_2910 [Colwellia psychrerythraea 34H]